MKNIKVLFLAFGILFANIGVFAFNKILTVFADAPVSCTNGYWTSGDNGGWVSGTCPGQENPPTSFSGGDSGTTNNPGESGVGGADTASSDTDSDSGGDE